MIDPVKITDYERTNEQLEELLCFCILVAGKNATRTAISLEKLLEHGRDFLDGSPFQIISVINQKENLASTMRSFGFGCFNIKSKAIMGAATSGLDLKTCSVEDLEAIFGIGMKTARYFILHSRKNARVSCLDIHLLRWLSYYTEYDVPKQTPSRYKYLELEQIFLKIADAMNVSPASLDLRVWNKQRGSDEESLVKVIRKKKTKILDG